jgi:hypothetical protein
MHDANSVQQLMSNRYNIISYNIGCDVCRDVSEGKELHRKIYCLFVLTLVDQFDKQPFIALILAHVAHTSWVGENRADLGFPILMISFLYLTFSDIFLLNFFDSPCLCRAPLQSLFENGAIRSAALKYSSEQFFPPYDIVWIFRRARSIPGINSGVNMANFRVHLAMIEFEEIVILSWGRGTCSSNPHAAGSHGMHAIMAENHELYTFAIVEESFVVNL